MPKFLITYSGIGHPSPEAMEQVRAAFGAWLANAGTAVIDPGAPIALRDQVAAGHPAPASDLSGYTIIEAASAGEARGILTSHPFIARGGTLQINECL